MIRALLKKQLLELGAAFVRSSKTGKRRSRAGAFGYALLFAVLMLLVMLSFGSMALPLAVTLVPQGLDWLYFVLMELSALTVSVLASAFTSYGHLFRCRDNQQLLALPIPPGAIFAVRCGGVYLTGLIYLLLAWVPSVVCYALAAPRPGGALLAALPVALALAGVSMPFCWAGRWRCSTAAPSIKALSPWWVRCSFWRSIMRYSNGWVTRWRLLRWMPYRQAQLPVVLLHRCVCWVWRQWATSRRCRCF